MDKLIDTKKLICLTILGAPLYLLRFEILSIPTNILELFIVATFLFWIYEMRIKETKKINTQILIPILLILFGIIISTLLNDNYRAGFGIIKGWFVLPIIFGTIIYNKTQGEKDIKKILICIFASTLLVSIFSLFYFFSGNLTFDGRLSSFYLSPNHLAMFIAPGLLIGLLFLINIKNGSSEKFFLLSGSLLIATTLYLTSSYAAILAVILSFSVTTFLTLRSSQKKSYRKILLTSLLVVILLISFQKNNDKFQGLINLDERSSLASRIMIWESSLKILSDNWILGIGPGNFQEKYLEYQEYFPFYLEWAVPQPHSLYLAFWLQGGLLGIIGFMWLTYSWIILQISNLGNKKQLTIPLIAVVLCILIHGLVDTPYWKNDLALIFWIIIFLGLIKPPASPKQKLFH